MGLFSSSKSSADTSVRVVENQPIIDAGADGGGPVITGLSDRNKINISTAATGLMGDDLGRVTDALTGARSEAVGLASQLAEQTGNLALAAASSQSEAGRIIGQLATPVLIVVGIYLFFKAVR